MRCVPPCIFPRVSVVLGKTPPVAGWRAVLVVCRNPTTLRRTVRIALVVGTVLTIINQLDVIIGGDATWLTGLKIAMNYCVPFIVSNLGVLAARPAE
jgi:hypothetical protein